ncbi:MAG: hypothetical protein ACNI26_13435 [Terasakiella sp.]|uniref:hypothetical protein n=1 Tax=unclassified Terasakiella TaxID=2614952 RepID=UPI003B002797
MAESDFQKLVLKYNHDALIWKKNKNGLHFLNSPYFGEWLQPNAAAIDCWSLASLSSVPSAMLPAERERFSARSTGKYKSRKIGFRMIYELD